MNFLDFFQKESSHSYYEIVFITVISGLANALLLSIVNHAAENINNEEVLIQFFVIYLICFVLFMYTQWVAFSRAIVAVEEALRTLRIRLTDKIRTVDLSFIENNTERGGIYTRLTQENALMSQAVPQLTAAAQAALLVFFSMCYLALISPISFVFFIIALVISVMFFLSKNAVARKSLRNVVATESRYLNSISHLIDGFKEIKVNQKKNDDLFEEIKQSSREAEKTKIEVGHVEMKMWGFGRNAVYLILPIFIFILPRIEQEHAADVYKITATLLFVSGPITLLISSMPLVNRMSVFINNIYQLEKELDAESHKRQNLKNKIIPEFETVELNNVSFAYPSKNDATPFSAGPFSLKITSGEIVFIVGGNGSGKSTFLKLFAGLYYPGAGSIRVNGDLINDDNYQSYRELFSIIFTDFHLFGRFYGLREVDETKVRFWLDKMKMAHKTDYQGGGFTNINLSTGQRKRLAFITSMLEEKPILVLDEFAADQDPQFRKFFYEELLPELKKRGITVIAVSHDDHYFHVADRVLKMDMGAIAELDFNG